MTRDNLLFAIIGVLFGFIVGFMLAGNISQREAASSGVSRTQNLPADHPAVGDSAAPQTRGGMQAEVQQALDKARNEPNNFEAQVNAANLYYQIQRYDQAIEYLVKANQLQPDDFETVANLGMVNMDAGHFEAAERWYKAALAKKPDDVRVLDGYCAVLLQEGKTKEADEAITKLAKADPNNVDLSKFRDKLDNLKSGKK
jgi:tetratricopeptide (TPR) repeat protein